MSRINRMMAKCVAQAYKSTEQNRHGCIIAKGSIVISAGWNKNKTHPAAKSYHSKQLHAELSAIVGCNEKDLVGSDLYICRIYRYIKDGHLGMSKPCHECMKIIQSAKIKRVYYTTNKKEIKLIKI